MLGKLRNFRLRKEEDPNWLGEEIETRVFSDVPHPDAPISKRQRKARIFLGCVLASLPFALLSCLMSNSARTTAFTASALAVATREALTEREQAEEPQLTVAAAAALQARLVAGRHPFAAAALVFDGFQIVDTGEEHTVGIVHNGVHALTARAVVDSGGTVGVTFGPAVYATLPDPDADRPEQCWIPPTPEGEREIEGSWLVLLGAGAEPDLTLTDYWPQDRVDVSAVDMAKLRQWLAAWVAGDMATMRELGSHLGNEPLPWLGEDGHIYAAGSVDVLSVVQLIVGGEQRMIGHVQFATCSVDGGGLLVQDLEIEMRQDGQLLRVLAGSSMGEPL